MPERIKHAHLKDVDAALAAKVQSGELTYTEAVAAGMYVPLGAGDVDIAGIVKTLEDNGYRRLVRDGAGQHPRRRARGRGPAGRRAGQRRVPADGVHACRHEPAHRRPRRVPHRRVGDRRARRTNSATDWSPSPRVIRCAPRCSPKSTAWSGCSTSYQDVVADPEVDVVYNPLANSLHAPWNLAAVAAGKPVLTEKPFARNAAEAPRVAAAADAAGSR